jgi:hypothetical protein
MKNYLMSTVLSGFFVLLVSVLYSQETYLISDEGSITTCSGILYDSGGAEGDYSSSEDYTITIISANADSYVRLFFEEFDLGPVFYSDSLIIYDGSTTESPVLVEYAFFNNLEGDVIVSSGSSLTIRMHTSLNLNRSGFKVLIECVYNCQDYEIAIVGSDPIFSDVDSSWIDICPEESVEFYAESTFPNNEINYLQSSDSLYFKWHFISNDISEYIEGWGMDTVEHTFVTPGGYKVYLSAIDQNHCRSYYDSMYRVRTPMTPRFYDIIMDDGVCYGEPLVLDGHGLQDIFYTGFHNFSPVCFDIPGGRKCFSLQSLSKNATINSAEDIISVNVNMEHSYSGDLDIVLECPNGQIVTLYEKECKNNFFGEPISESDCEFGIGYDYSWEMDAINHFNDFCEYEVPFPAGVYCPIESFEGLVGCPVDGEWCLHFEDNAGPDDGVVFSASLYVANGVMSNTDWTYTVGYDNSEESTAITWSGENIEAPSGGIVTIFPEVGAHYYNLSIVDNWGCVFNHDYYVSVYPEDDEYCQPFCSESILTATSGIVNDGSGLYPSQNNAQCTWLISPSEKSNSVILIEWDSFNVYPNDSLYIYNGNDNTGVLLGAYSNGVNLLETILTTEGTAFVEYITDSYYRSPGWEITYETVLVDNPSFGMDEIFIYPNPANEQLNIESISEKSKIIIYDLSGKVMKDVNADSRITVDISDLASGVYFVKVQSNNITEVLKFVKE